MTTEQEVKDHTKKLESGGRPCYLEACPHCAAEGSFKVHQCRRRSFRIVVENTIRVFRSWILRLKCPSCKRTFTDYPPFRLAPQAIREPHVAERARDFLGTEKSYRQAVKHQRKSLVYDDRQENPMAHRGAALAHSTLWRWLSWLGSLTRTRHSAMQLISQRFPGHALHRQMILIDPRKYRSESRGTTLQQAGGLLLVEAVFERRMKSRIFPRFATGCGWR